MCDDYDDLTDDVFLSPSNDHDVLKVFPQDPSVSRPSSGYYSRANSGHETMPPIRVVADKDLISQFPITDTSRAIDEDDALIHKVSVIHLFRSRAFYLVMKI